MCTHCTFRLRIRVVVVVVVVIFRDAGARVTVDTDG